MIYGDEIRAKLLQLDTKRLSENSRGVCCFDLA